MHNKIKKLSARRLKYFVESKEGFYKGHKTYFDGLKDEIDEVEEELKDGNSVYLEDELGDVFWNYICLLHSLEQEGKIESVEKVLERCYEKFSGRIGEDGKNIGLWNEIKAYQKEILKIEHNNKYKNDK